jgi:hypothetical protein
VNRRGVVHTHDFLSNLHVCDKVAWFLRVAQSPWNTREIRPWRNLLIRQRVSTTVL